MPVQFPKLAVNGASMSFGHIDFTIVGAGVYRPKGFVSVSYGESLDVAKGTVAGSNRAPQRRSMGEYNAEDSTISMYQPDSAALLKMLAAEGGGNYMGVEFDATLVFANPGESVNSVTLERCLIVGTSASHAAGPDLLMEDLTVQVMSISRDSVAGHG